MKNLKPMDITLYHLAALAFLISALPAFAQAQSLYSLTPTTLINKTRIKKTFPQIKSGTRAKIHQQPVLPHQDRWFSLSTTPTPISLKNTKIKSLQPDKNQPVIKNPKFSAWQMKFPRNNKSIYIGKDGKAASVLSALTPVTTSK